ncbi:phytanoyl-CoA dioxygenase family protein [Pseudomonas wadenswilerensis]
MTPREQLHRDGYILLRQAIPTAWLDTLRATFDAGARPSDQWPTPRGRDWLHSQLDTDPVIQQVCRLPQVLAAAGELIGERFFISQIDGRDPLPGGGHQQLHRDLSIQRPGDIANAMVYFDDYGPQNGATRFVPGSHRPAADAPPTDFSDESGAIQISGAAGDILVFDVDLIHAGSLNISGARRRSILVGYFSEPLYASHLETLTSRNIHMDTSERFEPADFAFPG